MCRPSKWAWATPVSLLSNLTTRHQRDDIGTFPPCSSSNTHCTHTHTALRRRLLSDCLSAPAWTPVQRGGRWPDLNCQVPGGQVSASGAVPSGAKMTGVRSPEGPRWPEGEGRDVIAVGSQVAVVAISETTEGGAGRLKVRWVWVLVCWRLAGYLWRQAAVIVQLFIIYNLQYSAFVLYKVLYHEHFQIRSHKWLRSLINYISDPFRSRRKQSVFPMCIALTFHSTFLSLFIVSRTKLHFFTSFLWADFRRMDMC